jgi:microcystin degradation protein MlrC
MKKIILTTIPILLLLLAISCNGARNQQRELPRIAIAGIAIESSTFSPAVTEEPAFRTRYGEDVFTFYPFFHPDSGIIDRAVWLPALRGHAMPGGIVTREAYESLMEQMLERLKASLPLDGLFFDIHGAMSVVGLDDAEGDMLMRVREVIGTDVVISTSMDPHGSVSKRFAQNTDLITAFRMSPHEDAVESRKRALTNLLNRLENGKGKPAYMAWIPVPILLPGEQTSTRVEPGKSLYGAIPGLLDGNNVIDAAIWMSYPWADEPRNHGVVMAYGDNREAVGRAAETLAEHFWRVRHEFDFVAPTTYFDDAWQQALASDVKPFFISDMGDNPTAGGAGDVTWTLHEIFKRARDLERVGKRLIYASIPGPELTRKAQEIGVGGMIDAYAGAIVDYRFAPPIRLRGEIMTIRESDNQARVEVVVRSGNIYTIVTENRFAYHTERGMTDLGLNPRETDIVVVKQGYLVPDWYNMQAGWVMALTPGGVDQDLHRLPYQRIMRPMFPLDPDMPDPDLRARFIPSSDVIAR